MCLLTMEAGGQIAPRGRKEGEGGVEAGGAALLAAAQQPRATR